jgi:GntR family transcriptional repressor for pyruvate dehydrogenase complex
VSDARRPEAIARRIRQDILSGRHRPGERLPSERELAAQTGSHRGVAREALKILAQQRLIEIRPGGSRVIPVHRASLDVLAHMLEQGEGADPALMGQLLDVHELLLAGAVRLAVERGSDAELARALELVTRLGDARIAEAEYLQTMAALLELIAEASRNLVLRMVGNGLTVVLAGVVPVLRRLRPAHAVLSPALASVREALVERDPAAAENGIRALLRLQREHVLKHLDAAAAARASRG